MTKAQANRSRKLASYYERQVTKTARNKARRLAKQRRMKRPAHPGKPKPHALRAKRRSMGRVAKLPNS